MIRQYANSPRIQALLASWKAAIDPTATINQFYNVVWNIDTAQGFGLDIWGRIVGVTRFVKIPGAVSNFGFQDGAAQYDNQPFGQATFYSGSLKTTTYQLQDNAFKVLILARAMTNVVAATSPNINKVLQQLFPGRGNAFVNDLGNMQMRYCFQFVLAPWEMAVLQSAGTLPRPTGVQAFIAQIPLTGQFGFNEAGANVVGFGQGTFLSNGAIANAA